MVDAHALGACGATRGGSSPLPPTRLRQKAFAFDYARLVADEKII